ncbi:hypothetical protein Lal_00015177 [Lupinus albus]|nr:hypothetical protein Lal_00015177 [Lupinus albus]
MGSRKNRRIGSCKHARKKGLAFARMPLATSSLADLIPLLHAILLKSLAIAFTVLLAGNCHCKQRGFRDYLGSLKESEGSNPILEKAKEWRQANRDSGNGSSSKRLACSTKPESSVLSAFKPSLIFHACKGAEEKKSSL